MKTLIMLTVALCIYAVPTVAKDPSPRTVSSTASDAAPEPRRTVQIPNYNPKCTSMLPLMQTYREVPAEEAEAAWRAYETCGR